ncbi:sugar transferase [Weissella confusa]|uniref:Sugar transferase n=1 Tax=Weissella confusa TaxID=1583 RepID=A0AAE2SAD6_WEICO|nr:sugar transferase [Weissella confusa]MBJ7633576.1 sugar transferase [Weissella confusa]MBJ7646339.1 sugar transferase [Weissella confusa]TGE52242.1 UDP-phosphate N-acetylgalactosaminyl-1-phosphate transferase [Weissella confusa]
MNVIYRDKLERLSEKKTGYLWVKRFFDFFGALLFLIPSAPIILIFAVLVKLDTPGPAFYTQERVGLMGKKIFVTKIRSMYDGIEKKSGAMWATKNDDRVTKIGRFMRKTRIDELPQILSVLKGDMSFIGPRPERPMFTKEFSEKYSGFERRLEIKPGLSGWAQVTGGYDMRPDEKMVADLFYIQKVSLLFDLKIILMTLRVVVTGDGAR